MAYTGTINIQNLTGVNILRWSFSHKSASFSTNLSSGQLPNKNQSTDIRIQSQKLTLTDSFTVHIQLYDPADQHGTGISRTVVIKCLWGKDDNGGTGHLYLRPTYAELTTPKGTNCQENYT